jgi:hypothetical protein
MLWEVRNYLYSKTFASVTCLVHRERENWERAIEEWQEPVLSDPELPAWFKSGTEGLVDSLISYINQASGSC